MASVLFVKATCRGYFFFFEDMGTRTIMFLKWVLEICVVLKTQFLFLFVRSRNGHSPKCIMGRNGGTQKIIQGIESSLAKSHHGTNSAYQNGEGEQDPSRYMYTAVSRLLSLSRSLFSVHDTVDYCKNSCCSSFTSQRKKLSFFTPGPKRHSDR